MANPGVGTKFVSVNLNKSYGQHHHSNSSWSGRSRGSAHGSSGNGGGMVVLSRPRSSHKAAGPKLSVPPPLNLPSLRKEHEKFDLSGSGSGTAGGGVSGGGMRPGSSGMRWTKPVTAPLSEKDGLVISDRDASVGIDQDMHKGINAVNQGSTLYTPPSARLGSAGPVVSASPAVEKVSVLRGEDFPSLRATLAATSGPVSKQKDGFNQKQKQAMGDESGAEQKECSRSSCHVEMLPQPQVSQYTYSGGLHENGDESQSMGGSKVLDQRKKQDDYFSGPLPLVRFNPRSDWADDERDTSHCLSDRSRDLGFSKGESYWDGDFDMPRASVVAQKPAYDSFDRLGQRDNEAGKISSSEVSKADPYGRGVRMPSREGREGYSWRTSSPLSGDGVISQEAKSERNNYGVRPSAVVMDARKENNIQSPIPDDFGRKESMSGQWRLPWNKAADSFSNHGTDRISRDRYGGEQFNKYDGFRNNVASKNTFGVKVFPSNNPMHGLARDKHYMSKSEKPYLEDPFLKDVDDGRDPLSGGLVGVLKRKKDVLKQTDFHDPVRESFEAELERVQKLQEQERQRILEEQEKAMELARREEEERMRLAREQEERQRRLEEEAREAAWRAEQERLEALRRAEEQKIVREEEKRRIVMEEERRKQAAKQKLLELEERMAKRQADVDRAGSNSIMVDENVPRLLKERDDSRLPDVGGVWDESERMVERITTSSSDSSGMNRPFEISSRANLSRDTPIKPANTWRRDPFESGTSSNLIRSDQDVTYGPRRDSSFGGRGFQKKEFHGGVGYVSSRNYPKGGMPEPSMDEFPAMKGQRWNLADGDHHGKSTHVETEFPENLSDRLGDMDWGQSRPHGNSYSSYSEQFYQNSDLEGPYSFGRARYSMRQPRVLPPPSVTSMQKSSSYRGEMDRPGPSVFMEKEMQYNTTAGNESTMQMGYDSGRQDILEDKSIIKQEFLRDPRVDQSGEPRCDSQSSLSVSSPPDSPIHLSHDDLDESGDYPAKSALEDNSDFLISDDGAVPVTSGQENILSATCSLSGDDGEWTVENNEHLQEQEEYDEDEEAYGEEDEVREGDDGNIDLSEEFDNMHLGENMVLGFNDNVEVCVTNVEFEKSSMNDESAFMIPLASCESVENETAEKLGTSEQPRQLTDGSAQVSMGCSMLPDNERVTQNISTSNFAVTPATSDTPNSMDASHSSSLPIQPSSSNLVSHSSGHTLSHSSPAVSAQTDLPIKLQFGLFSGPPLIPSAVPAIQIGTIQMPLHLNSQIGTALGPMQQSQPPIFQFGQLRYASPISPGVVPLAPQTMSLVQSNPPNNSINQKPGGPTSMQSDQDSTSVENIIKNDVLLSSADKQSGFALRYVDQPLGNTLSAVDPLQTGEKAESTVPSLQNEVDHSQVDGSRSMDDFKAQEQEQEHQKATAWNYRTFSNSKVMAGRSQIGWTSSQSVKKEKDLNGSKVPGPVTSSRGKRYIFKVKNPAARTFFQDTEGSNLDSAGHQRRPKRTVKRTEFRVREIGEKRPSSGFDSPHELGIDNRSNVSTRYTVFSARSGSGKAIPSSKHVKQASESEGTRMDPGNAEDDTGSTNQTIQRPHSAGGNFKRSSPSEDVDAPLQSGIVRVFEQPGIEAPSDEDDFIEVRSKRQMLIDKREQREKEIKAKSRVMKVPRKPRHSQSSNGLAISKKTTSVRTGERETHADFVPEGRGSSNLEVSVGFKTSMTSQPLAPIGTPAVKSEAQSDTRHQKFNSFQVGSSAGQNLGTGLIFESKNKALDKVQTSLDAWGNSGINQQVMALTQSQLDDAMKPAQFDSGASGGDHIVSVTEPAVSSTSMLTKEKSFSSSASPINSLLAGEKIQFGAVTSPTVLPPSSHAVSLGIGPPGLCRPDIQIPHKLPAVESGCNLFFEKENNSEEACVQLEEAEAEAEAAASAVAVAAISNNDDLVGNGLGACSISVSDAKTFSSADVDDITAGVNGDKQLANPSRSDESLNVSLPADLSVETPPISLWPSLSGSQSTSSPMISHFPGGRPLLPFYEMNPMIASPIFAFGPNEESTSVQSQSQKSSTTSSGLPGTWPHSGVDSFYGPPAGFTGPFIGPSGMPGVQGPPHMVVYNHFAPVGQFGQVGLSIMGTAFIPSGKQPDWKHNPASSPMIGEGDVNNLNLVSAQRNTSSVPPPIQHLAPGSPLLPMASPLAMFDVSPFQSSPEMSVHTRWSHVPASPLQSVSMSMPLPQQGESGVSSQFNGMPNVDQSMPINRFAETRSSTPSGSTHNCIESTDATSNQLPDELGLVEPASSSSVPSTQTTAAKLSSIDVGGDTCNANVLNTSNSSVGTSSSMKNHCLQKNVSNQYYSNSSGFSYQRGSASQKNNSGGEWPHRRTAFQGRNNSFGAEKNSSTKVKQIYVAKQTIGGKSATS